MSATARFGELFDTPSVASQTRLEGAQRTIAELRAELDTVDSSLAHITSEHDRRVTALQTELGQALTEAQAAKQDKVEHERASFEAQDRLRAAADVIRGLQADLDLYQPSGPAPVLAGQLSLKDKDGDVCEEFSVQVAYKTRADNTRYCEISGRAYAALRRYAAASATTQAAATDEGNAAEFRRIAVAGGLSKTRIARLLLAARDGTI